MCIPRERSILRTPECGLHVQVGDFDSSPRRYLTWSYYTGQDNTNSQCTVGDVPNIFDGDESDHDGPYDGVEMGC